MSFDEINALQASKHPRAMPYSKYFGEMHLTAEQKRERISFAENFEEKVFELIALAYTVLQFGGDMASVQMLAESIMLAAINATSQADAYLTLHAASFAQNFVDATVNHADDPYYFSEDRSKVIAENEANIVQNHLDYVDAINNGYRFKRWDAIVDNKTRDTHLEVNGTVVPIDEPFIVGGYEMMYPGSDELGAPPEEIVNCRCSVEYLMSEDE
jgi:uncharacterized protein with gpF-like domain